MAASPCSGFDCADADLMQPVFHRQPVSNTRRFRVVADLVQQVHPIEAVKLHRRDCRCNGRDVKAAGRGSGALLGSEDWPRSLLESWGKSLPKSWGKYLPKS